nr:chalcone isomerase family protein [uncultured Roseateles sp.]
MNRRSALLLSLPAWMGGPAWAQDQAPAEVRAELPQARRQGQGLMRFLGLSIYTIRLWAPDPVSAETWSERPLALEIEYARSLDGTEIARRSLKEMQRVGDFTASQGERWLAAMGEAFPDVRSGDRITGFQRPGQMVRFYVNGRPGKDIADALFARLFFGIWLSPRTSEPGLREALLGLRS